MPYTEAELRTALEEHSARPPTNPDRYDDVRRRVRRATARRTTGTALAVAVAIAGVGAGIVVPGLTGDRNTVLTPVSGTAPGSDRITLVPKRFGGLPRIAGAQFKVAEKHRMQLTFVPKSQNFKIMIWCEDPELEVIEGGVAGGGIGSCGGKLGSVSEFGAHSGAQDVVPGEPVTIEIAFFPNRYLMDATDGEWEELERLLTDVPWPEGEPRKGSWAIGVYDAKDAKPPAPGRWISPGDEAGQVSAVQTPSRPVTLLPDAYQGEPRLWGKQHPADGKLRRLTVEGKRNSWRLIACSERGAWYVERSANGHFAEPWNCWSTRPTDPDVYTDLVPGKATSVEIAAFPASVPMPKTEAELVRLLNDPPAGEGVEWALGSYRIPEGYDGP